MLEGKNVLFEAHVDYSAGIKVLSASERCQSWIKHLKKLDMDKSAIFYINEKNNMLYTEFPSGLYIADNGDSVVFASTKKDIDMQEAKNEVSVMANYLMRRGWKSAKLFTRSADPHSPNPLAKQFSQSAQEACQYISQEILAAYQKNGRSVA